jgi:hypothetical protein
MNALVRARDELKAARYSGVRRVRDQNGEEIEYRSDAEMARALATIEAEIAALASKPRTSFTFKTSKGL